MTANEDIKKFKTIFRGLDTDNKVSQLTVDCYGPNIPENTLDNEHIAINICQAEFARLNVTPLKVEGLDHE